jgi:P-type Ca2+ transporter type 2C
MYTNLSAEEAVRKLRASHEGLSGSEVEMRLIEFGFNEMPEKKRSLILLFLKQFHSTLVYILLGALTLSIVLPYYEHASTSLSTGSPPLGLVDFMDAIAIGAILVLNALLGFFQEKKAENAIAILQQMSAPNVKVRRDGRVAIISSRELVPGDVLLLEEGDRVSADARVLSSRGIAVDEASLTGESKPARKKVDALPGQPSLGDQTNCVFRGTVVTDGRAEALVYATGLNTEIGKIATLVSTVEHPPTPLEKSMMSLGRWLGAVVIFFCAVIFVAGKLHGMPIGEMLLASASLAVSAVPEGLPAIVTVCLAIGVQRMIKRKVLTRELKAIETLGSITVICTDKTGTLTENQMEVREIVSDDRELLLEIACSCNNAHSLEVGDPTEIGLLEAAQKAGVSRRAIVGEDIPFSSETMYMMTTHEVDGREVKYLKGALENILSMCTHILENGRERPITHEDRCRITKQNEHMAAKALRILGFSYCKGLCLREEFESDTPHYHRPLSRRMTPSSEPCDVPGRKAGTEKSKMVYVGLAGMLDPPREGVKDAIARARQAGIRTVIITGDHALTAGAVGKLVGVESDVLRGDEIDHLHDGEMQMVADEISIFARVTPTHKVRLLKALQDSGEIVAMGGDGVNDAPALKRAHVGFAMGKRGTDVARETAEIVLTDDHYESVVAAVEEGRTIYDNIRKFVVFLLRANFDELAVVLISIVSGLPLPYLPIHILLINLMTDSLPAMALAMEKPEKNVMRRLPRNPKQHILHGEVFFIVLAAIVATIAAFHVFAVGGGMDGSNVDLARTMVVVTSIMFELTLVFTCRSRRSLLEIGPFSNRYLLGAVAIAFTLLLLLLYTPLALVVSLVPLTLSQWILPFAWSFGALVFFELLKIARVQACKLHDFPSCRWIA